MNMREKIARVLATLDGMHQDAVSNDEDETPVWRLYLDDADAVLDALMEPTEGMVEESVFAAYHYSDEDDKIHNAKAFKAMIQAARDGK